MVSCLAGRDVHRHVDEQLINNQLKPRRAHVRAARAEADNFGTGKGTSDPLGEEPDPPVLLPPESQRAAAEYQLLSIITASALLKEKATVEAKVVLP